jgi:hypothetical protein
MQAQSDNINRTQSEIRDANLMPAKIFAHGLYLLFEPARFIPTARYRLLHCQGQLSTVSSSWHRA